MSKKIGILIKKFRAEESKNIILDVWGNEAIVNDEKVIIKNIKITRAYPDKNGLFHYVSHFRERDLPYVIEVIEDYYKWNNEQDDAE